MEGMFSFVSFLSLFYISKYEIRLTKDGFLMNNMLTLEEVRSFLEIEQDELEKYLKQGKLKAYKIGGTYIRFRKEDILSLRADILPRRLKTPAVTFSSRLYDFWRFNNFYILSILVLAMIVFLIAKI